MSNSNLVFEGYRDGNYALFVADQNGGYQPVTLNGAAGGGTNYLQDVGPELGIAGHGTQFENYIGGPDLVERNGDTYLQAQTSNGGGLFVYDPFNGTSQQIPINDGQSVNQPVDLITYDGQVYFDNYAVPQGALVGAVGTLFEVVQRHAPQGTSLIANAVSGGPQNPSSMTVFDNKLFMNGVDSNNKYDLFSYNGTTFTKISGTTGLNPTDLTAAGNDLVFNGLDSSGNNALYAYYKSSNGSYVPEKVDPGSSSYSDAQGNHGRDPLDITYSGSGGTNNESSVFYSGVTDNNDDRGLFYAKVGPNTGEHQITDASGHGPSNLDPSDLILDDAGDLFFTGNDGTGRGLYVAPAGSNYYHEVLSSAKYNFSNDYNSNWGNLNPTTLTYEGAGHGSGDLYFGATGPGTGTTSRLWEMSVSGSGSHLTFGTPTQAASSVVDPHSLSL